MLVAALLVFAPFVLYSWAAIGPQTRPEAQETREAAGPPARDVALTGCRVDPATRRVSAEIAVTAAAAHRGTYRVTVDFRRAEQAAGEGAKGLALVDVREAAAGAVRSGRAVGPVWPRGVVPYCGVYAVAVTAGP